MKEGLKCKCGKVKTRENCTTQLNYGDTEVWSYRCKECNAVYYREVKWRMKTDAELTAMRDGHLLHAEHVQGELDNRRLARIVNEHSKAAETITHKTRFSDSSLYDEICTVCGATDAAGDDGLTGPCMSAKLIKESSNEHSKAAETVPHAGERGLTYRDKWGNLYNVGHVAGKDVHVHHSSEEAGDARHGSSPPQRGSNNLA